MLHMAALEHRARQPRPPRGPARTTAAAGAGGPHRDPARPRPARGFSRCRRSPRGPAVRIAGIHTSGPMIGLVVGMRARRPRSRASRRQGPAATRSRCRAGRTARAPSPSPLRQSPTACGPRPGPYAPRSSAGPAAMPGSKLAPRCVPRRRSLRGAPRPAPRRSPASAKCSAADSPVRPAPTTQTSAPRSPVQPGEGAGRCGRGGIPRGRMRARPGRWRTEGSYVQQQVLTFPRADDLQEFVVLGLFHDRIDAAQFTPQDLLQRVVGVELVQCGGQSAGIASGRVISVAAMGRGRSVPVHQPR